MPDNHHRLAFQSGQTADDGWIIGISAISVQLMKIGEHVFDIVQRIRPARMPGKLGNLPVGKIGEDGLGQSLTLVFQLLQGIGNIDIVVKLDIAEFFNFRF